MVGNVPVHHPYSVIRFIPLSYTITMVFLKLYCTLKVYSRRYGRTPSIAMPPPPSQWHGGGQTFESNRTITYGDIKFLRFEGYKVSFGCERSCSSSRIVSNSNSKVSQGGIYPHIKFEIDSLNMFSSYECSRRLGLRADMSMRKP